MNNIKFYLDNIFSQAQASLHLNSSMRNKKKQQQPPKTSSSMQ